MKYYLGMDIGGTKCAVILSEENADSIKDKIRFETRVEKGYNAIVDELISSAKEILCRNGIDSCDVLACGVSCGGPLNADTGVIMCPPNLPDWDNVPLADTVTESLGIPCKVRNDADACALAEWQFGAGKGTKNMIFLTFGTGMGAGLILDGKLYSGTNGTAGEVGHIRLDADGPVAYGKAGSFEGFCSGAGIAAMAKKMLSIYNGTTTIPRDNVTAKSIADAAAKGDKLANAIYRRKDPFAITIEHSGPHTYSNSDFGYLNVIVRIYAESALQSKIVFRAKIKIQINIGLILVGINNFLLEISLAVKNYIVEFFCHSITKAEIRLQLTARRIHLEDGFPTRFNVLSNSGNVHFIRFNIFGQFFGIFITRGLDIIKQRTVSDAGKAGRKHKHG